MGQDTLHRGSSQIITGLSLEGGAKTKGWTILARLNERDVALCVARLNPTLRSEMQGALCGVTVVAGGFVRSVVSGETVNDIDVFVTSDVEVGVINDRMRKAGFTVDSSPNAQTMTQQGKTPVQVITRWMFGNSEKIKELRKSGDKNKHIATTMMLQEVIESFDFTVCQAGLIYMPGIGFLDLEERGWIGICSDTFYEDLCAKRLVYTKPDRKEDAGGSILRLLKYTARGYRATLDSVAAIAARWVMGTDSTTAHDGKMKIDQITIGINEAKTDGSVETVKGLDEAGLAEILSKRLVEIDPPIDVSILPYSL
jgi:hypothetical protein